MESVWENAAQKRPSNSLKNKGLQGKAKGQRSFEDSIVFETVALKKTGAAARPEFFPKTPQEANGLAMAGKQLGDSGVSLVAQKLQSGHNYSALFLSNNNIGDSGLQVLASTLKKDTQVQHLILSNNKITSFAMAALADLLKVNHHIGWLVLNKNAVGNFGIKTLADAMAVNHGVKHLVLSDNEISSEGAILLLKGLQKNTTLKSLFLQGNSIDEHIYKELEKLIMSTQSIELIDLRETPFSRSESTAALQKRAAERGITLYI
jgi:Ran GTPase-activating protein (RanGAP) involved in mRNA processing and transport